MPWLCPLCQAGQRERAAVTGPAGRQEGALHASTPHSLLNSCGLWKAPRDSPASGVTLGTGQVHRDLPFAARQVKPLMPQG